MAIINIETEQCKLQKICDSDFSVQWLLDSLVANDPKYVEQHGHRKLTQARARDISGGKGMFSVVLKCELMFEDSEHENDVYTTIIKIPATSAWEKLANGKKLEELEFAGLPLLDTVIDMHKTECNFYKIIGHHVPEIVPVVFHTQEWKVGEHQGCLHMEDLSLRGKNMDYHNAFSHGQLRNLVRHLAYLHKTILCLEERVWKGKFISQKDVFINMMSTVKDLCPKFLEMTPKTTALRKLFDHPKIQKMVYNQKYVEYAVRQLHRDVGIPDLLVHADLWASNIIFVADENGFPTDQISAILDWQIVSEGNMLFDFVRPMICSLEGDTRREAEMYIFDFYVDELNKCLKPQGKEAPYSAEQVKRAYEYAFMGHFSHSLMMAGGLLASRSPQPGEELAEQARIDKCALRSVHVLEDALRLIETGIVDEWIA